MDNRNNGYAPLLLFLSQMMKKSQQAPADPQTPANTQTLDVNMPSCFSCDETRCTWRRMEDLQPLTMFCREGYAMAKKHGHYILGSGENGTFIGIPGRFLIEEQPAGGETGFKFWLPLAGGELHYETLENLSEDEASRIYGYWIARLNPETLKISEF